MRKSKATRRSAAVKTPVKVSRNRYDLRDMANWLIKIANESATVIQPLHASHLRKFASRMKEIANLV